MRPRQQLIDLAWEFARTVAAIDKQLLSSDAVERIAMMLQAAEAGAFKEMQSQEQSR